jgi:hypothetical protein
MVVKNEIPKEWLMKFFEKSGDDALIITNLTVTDFGFASFDVDGDELVIYQLYGNGKLWDKFFMDLVKKMNLKKIKFGTKRNPEGFEKKFGYKLVGYILEKEVKQDG